MANVSVRKLRDQFDKFMTKKRFADAVRCLEKLEELEPDASGWPHRLGDLHRRMGDTAAAVEAYERAVVRYQQEGFLPRAVAMAKTVVGLDPERAAVLQSLEPARRSVAPERPSMVGGVMDMAKSLMPAKNVAPDEVRFEDTPEDEEDGIDLNLEELEDLVILDPVEESELHAPDHTAERLAALPMFALFADVPREALHRLAEHSELVELAAGDAVLRTGDPADALYCITEGRVRVRIPGMDRVKVALGEGDLFGEACLLHDEPRHADVDAETPLTALRVPKSVLDDLVAEFPEVGKVLMNLLTRRLLVNLLRTSPLFSPFDAKTRREVARLFEVRKAPARTVLLERDKRSDGLYIALTGKLLLAGQGAAPRVLPAGSVVGQASLLSSEPSRIAVRTETDTVLLRLSAARFAKLAQQFPAALEKLADNTQDLDKMAI